MRGQLYSLKNGLSVLFIPSYQPSMTVLLLVGAGSRYENEKNNGIAHFFEHMAFKGSKKYPNTKIISETIEATGGIFNAFTSKDHTGYWIKATPKHFEVMVDVLSDMIINPLLSEEEIEREKGVIVEEINMYEDTPQQKVSDIFETLLYGNHSLGLEIAGKKETVKSFNRKTFVDYMKSLYHPNNAVLVVAGGLEASNSVFSQTSSPIGGFPKSLTQKKVSALLSIIQKKFSGWQNGEKVNFSQITYQQKEPKIEIRDKKTEQAHFVLGYPTFGFFDKRRYVLSVLATIMGGGMSSRLFLEVRERRGLCYYIHTDKQLYHEIGSIITQAGIVNNLDKIKEAVSVILKEIEKIKKGEVKEEELKKAKEMVRGRFLLSLEDTFRVAHFFGTKKLLEDEVIDEKNILQAIEKVNLEAVVDLAREIFLPEKINFALIGPYKKEEFKNLF